MKFTNAPTIELTEEELHVIEDFACICKDLDLASDNYYNLLNYILDSVSIGTNDFLSGDGDIIKIVVTD